MYPSLGGGQSQGEFMGLQRPPSSTVPNVVLQKTICVTRAMSVKAHRCTCLHRHLRSLTSNCKSQSHTALGPGVLINAPGEQRNTQIRLLLGVSTAGA